VRGSIFGYMSTIRGRELGEALRLAMERAELNGRRTAHMLGWAESKVSRLLTGRIKLPESDISAILAILHVTGVERARLLDLAREQHTPGWLQQHGSNLPEQLKTLVDHESKATSIVAFEVVRIPGLLQTGDYARALLERSATVPPSEVQGRVATRLARRNLFSTPKRPRFTFYLHEFVLRLPVGDREVMSEQLHELLRMGVRSYITIRIIPAAIGAHASMSGACRLMEFDEFKPVAYIEEETAGHFLEEPDEIAAYRRIFASMANFALDEGQSRDLIAKLVVELYGDGETDDRQ
jgi:transcriptional regulator with XRE-family HTH domain